MLSYRHSYHAGNHADVLKHLILTLVIEYLTQKDKPLVYVDTHAGAGSYSLSSIAAQQTGEYASGIGKLWKDRANLPALMQPYLAVVAQHQDKLQTYPGSPLIAQRLLRSQDRLELFELHPQDFASLNSLFQGQRKVQVHNVDSLSGVLKRLPPVERRGLILIDPAYEIKTDYLKIPDLVKQCYQRFATGTYLIWYPVVWRPWVEQMQQKMCENGLAKLLQVELLIAPDQEDRGLTGSGMFIVNPPYVLAEQLQQLLPQLVKILAPHAGSFKLVDQSVVPS